MSDDTARFLVYRGGFAIVELPGRRFPALALPAARISNWVSIAERIGQDPDGLGDLIAELRAAANQYAIDMALLGQPIPFPWPLVSESVASGGLLSQPDEMLIPSELGINPASASAVLLLVERWLQGTSIDFIDAPGGDMEPTTGMSPWEALVFAASCDALHPWRMEVTSEVDDVLVLPLLRQTTDGSSHRGSTASPSTSATRSRTCRTPRPRSDRRAILSCWESGL